MVVFPFQDPYWFIEWKLLFEFRDSLALINFSKNFLKSVRRLMGLWGINVCFVNGSRTKNKLFTLNGIFDPVRILSPITVKNKTLRPFKSKTGFYSRKCLTFKLLGPSSQIFAKDKKNWFWIL